jgi:ABC-type polysaccharide/polyol phosphate export permease
LSKQPRYYAAARGSYAGEVANAVADFRKSFQQTPLWSAQATNDILQRYRGSILGPFWIVLTTAAFAIGIGLVYSQIMRVEPEAYLPWIATGVVVWNLFALTIQEGTDAFIAQSSIIRQTSTPLPVFIWRVVLRSLINLAHQMVVVIGVAVYFGYVFKIQPHLALLGMLLTIVNVTWIVILAAIISARFRDLQQALNSVLQILFFLSPVIWIPSETRAVGRLLEVNPVYHMLDVTRGPLLGQGLHMSSVVYLLIMAVGGWAAAFLVYAAVRRRIVHYL